MDGTCFTPRFALRQAQGSLRHAQHLQFPDANEAPPAGGSFTQPDKKKRPAKNSESFLFVGLLGYLSLREQYTFPICSRRPRRSQIAEKVFDSRTQDRSCLAQPDHIKNPQIIADFLYGRAAGNRTRSTSTPWTRTTGILQPVRKLKIILLLTKNLIC